MKKDCDIRVRNRRKSLWFAGMLGICLGLWSCGQNTDELLLEGLEEVSKETELQTGSVETTGDSQTEENSFEETQMADERYIYVHVCGAVQTPGVYKLRSDARIVDAISAAGGLSEDAAGDYLNLAAVLSDGEKITVPSLSEAAEYAESSGMEEMKTDDWQAWTEIAGGCGPEEETDGNSDTISLVSINKAELTELMELPGIGESKAQSIIDYRTEHGGFDSTEELMEVNGIGETLYEQLKDRICL